MVLAAGVPLKPGAVSGRESFVTGKLLRRPRVQSVRLHEIGMAQADKEVLGPVLKNVLNACASVGK